MEEKKETYEKPAMKVLEVQLEQSILVASGFGITPPEEFDWDE